MQIEATDEKENSFFRRKEVRLKIKHSQLATPSKQELIKELAAKYNKAEDCIIVDYIFTKKGIGESEAKVKIYEEKPVGKEKVSKKEEEKVESSKKVKKLVKEGEKSETQTSKTK